MRHARAFVAMLCIAGILLAVGALSASAAPGGKVPGAPLNVAAVGGDEQATVSFDPPASSGSKPVTRYRVTTYPGGGTTTGSGSPIVVDDLDNGRSYTFTVAAENAVGQGPASAPSAPVTPVSPQPIVVTYPADAAGGSSRSARTEYRFQREWEDDENPARTIFAEATGPGGAQVGFTVPPLVGSGGSSGAVVCTTRNGIITSPAGFALGATVVTCSRAGRHGRGEHVTFVVVVRDTTAPALALPAAITVPATGPTGSRVSFTATATDLVDGARPVTCAPPSGSLFPVGTTTVSCTAADRRGNRATGAFRVTVTQVAVDSVPPAVTVPADRTLEATGPGGATATFSAGALDAVDGPRPVTCTPASGSLFPLGSTTVVCTASDLSGNTGSASFSVKVADTTAPVVTAPANAFAEATSPAGAAVTFAAATATDAVTFLLAPVCAPTGGSVFPLGSSTVTCSVADAAGNTGSASFTVTVSDTTPPAIPAHADVAAEATGPDGAAVTFTTTAASDLVSGVVAQACAPASGSLFALGATTVTCTATDAAGNSASTSFAVTVGDSTPPVVTAPAPATAEATGPAGAAVTYGAATATDAVSTGVAASCAPVSGSVFPIGDTTVACTATDAAGNTAGATTTVTVTDTTPPVLDGAADQTVEATGPAGAEASFAVTAADLVDGTTAALCTTAAGIVTSPLQLPLGPTAITCSSSDTRGNSASATFTITVVDTTAPDVSVPAGGVTLEAAGPTGAFVAIWAGAPVPAGPTAPTAGPTAPDPARPSATDVVSGDISPTCVPALDSEFALGTTTVTCTATDAAGNTGSASFSVVVQDTTPPELVVPRVFTAQATSSDGATVDFVAPVATGKKGHAKPPKGGKTRTVTAFDLVDGQLEPGCVPASGSLFPRGSTAVTCTATDAAGNSVSAAFQVLVVDVTSPVVTVPAAITAEAVDGGGASVAFDVSQADPDDAGGPVTCATGAGDIASPAQFPVGDTEVVCSATDPSGNVGSGLFTVSIVDTTAPVVSPPADLTVEATGPAGAPATVAPATAIDTVDGDVPVICSTASTFGTLPLVFPLGATAVSCTATDAHGNTGSASYTVFVVDTTAPDVTLPAGGTFEAESAAGATVMYADGTATDLVSGPAHLVCTPAAGSVFAIGDTVVTCTASDAAGNSASGAFTITVGDTTAPTVTTAGDVSAEARGADGAPVTFADATAADLVDGAIPATCDPASGSLFPLGVYDVTCLALDAHGNIGYSRFSVTVVDTTPPRLDVPATPLTVEATGPDGATAAFNGLVSAWDLVDLTLAPDCQPASGSLFGLGETTVACSATDVQGNTASATFLVDVVDTTPPDVSVEITSPTNPDGSVEATEPAGATPVVAAKAVDLVSGPVGAKCLAAKLHPLGTSTVLCVAADRVGNRGEATLSVRVVDTTAPSIDPMRDVTAEAAGAKGTRVGYHPPATSDIVDGPGVATCLPASKSTFPLGSTPVDCSATDAAGNTRHTTFNVVVVDTTPPVVTTSADITAEATGPAGAAVVYPEANAVDLVDGGVVPDRCLPAAGSTFPVGSTQATCSATDSHGNTATAAFTITVVDTTPPVLTAPAVTTPLNGHGAVEATGPAGAAVDFAGESATDLVSGSLPVTCAPPSGSTFALSTTSVVCSATDAAGNTATAILVVRVDDTTPPVVSVPASVSGQSPTGVPVPVTYLATANDSVDGAIAVTCTKPTGSSFPVGTTLVTCSAADVHGNTGSASFQVTVVTVPGAPTATTATAGNGSATVAFAAPASNGGSPVTQYTVTSSPPGGTASGSSSPITVSGLTNGTPYTFTVVAKNAVGTGPASVASAPVTPDTPPTAPNFVQASPSNASALVSWSAGASNGGSPTTKFTVTSSPGGLTATAAGTDHSVIVFGLTNGQAYTFSVVATNAAGNSQPGTSGVPVTPIGPPSAPVSVTAAAGAGSATVSFTAPASNGGSPITGYTVTSSPGGITASGSASPITVSGLANGTAYTFTVTAANAAYPAGTASTPSNSVTLGLSFSSSTVGVNGALSLVALASPAGSSTPLVAGGGGGISILGNSGGGVFSATASFPGAAAPSLPGIGVGDINGDGFKDIVSLRAVLFGQAGGGYVQQTLTPPTGGDAGAVDVGDINGDGIADIAYANFGGGTVTVSLGRTGNPGLWAPAVVETDAAGANPFSVALGDVNGDGRKDVVVANGSSASVSVFFGSATAPYLVNRHDYAAAPASFPDPSNVTLADVNGDGKLDILSVARGPGQISTFLNTGAGLFAGQITTPVGPPGSSWDPRAVSVGDINGDGKADVVLAIQWDLNAGVAFNRIAVLYGNNSGSFGSEQDFTVGTQPVATIIGDFNGDGRKDIAVANAASNTVTIMLQS